MLYLLVKTNGLSELIMLSRIYFVHACLLQLVTIISATYGMPPFYLMAPLFEITISLFSLRFFSAIGKAHGRSFLASVVNVLYSEIVF